MKKIVLGLLISLFVIGQTFSENWYVCLGSFKSMENARNLVLTADSIGYEACICEAETSIGKLYRVLLDYPFEKIEEARIKRDEVSKDSALTGKIAGNMWVCKADPFINLKEIKNPQPKLKKDILKDNQDVQLSKEKPYSVLIHSYREEQNAIKGRERLKEKNIDSYILKSFDDVTLFNFNLHSGVFETEEKAELLQEELVNQGIETEGVSDFNEISEKIEKYNEVVQKENITFETVGSSVSSIFDDKMIETIKEVPVSNDYQLLQFCINNVGYKGTLDFKYSFGTIDGFEGFGSFEEYISDIDKASLAIFACFMDEIYENYTDVYYLTGKKGCFASELLDDEKEEVQFTFGKMDCVIQPLDDYGYSITGISSDESRLIQLIIYTDSEEDARNVLQEFTKGGSVLEYDQIRKNMYILPDSTESNKKILENFVFCQVDQSYADSKGNVNWAEAVVGHNISASQIVQNGSAVEVGVFDLDYDYIARKNQAMFIENHPNQSVDFKTNDAIYTGRELSFSQNSCVIAIDSDMSFENEVEFAEEMRIWE